MMFALITVALVVLTVSLFEELPSREPTTHWLLLAALPPADDSDLQ